MIEVDITDLFRAILSKDSASVVTWLCSVRDVDCRGSNAKSHKISSACDAVLSSLIRLFCARYINRSLLLVTTFKDLLNACCDASVNLYARWQRICNVCAFMCCNSPKQDTIHVYPLLASPIMELDEHDDRQRQPKKNGLAKWFEAYTCQLVRHFEGSVEGPATIEWLEQDTINNPKFKERFVLMEHLILNKRIKELHRLVTGMIMHGTDVRTNFYTDILTCMWHILDITLTNLLETSRCDENARDYINAAHAIFNTLLPTKRNARMCRLALLHYALIVVCDGKTRQHATPPSAMTINLPITVPKELAYLSIFPSVKTIRE